jgi:hypothetical protein
MTLSAKDKGDLDRFYAIGGFEKSIQGGIQDACILRSAPAGRTVSGFSRLDADNNLVCQGLGWSELNEFGEVITARPGQGQDASSKASPNEELVDFYGEISAKLRMLSPRHRAALQAIYGDNGSTSARGATGAGGSLEALYPVTELGRAYLRLKRKQGAKGKKRIETSKAQAERDDGNVASAEGAALRSALDLKAAAEEAYGLASAEVDADRRRRKKLVRRAFERGAEEE